MGERQSGGMFQADFTFTDAILDDFEALYLDKKETPLATRVALGALGGAGAVYFGYSLYAEGVQLTRICYLLICSVMLVLAFSRSGKRPDDTLAKYRKYYLGRAVHYRIDDEGVEMKLADQKNPARSKFREVYGLFDTDRCLYILINGRAYYILPKDSVAGGAAEDLMKYLRKKCGKSFQHFDLKKA